jgi:hypothetical protein
MDNRTSDEATLAESPAPRSRGASAITVAFLLSSLFAVFFGTAYYKDSYGQYPWQSSALTDEAMVYIAEGEPYFYYELTTRAKSLGITEASTKYRESVAREAGYLPVPEGAKDVDAIAARNEAARLQAEVVANKQPAEVISDIDPGIREQIEIEMRLRIQLQLLQPLNAIFGEVSIEKINLVTYRAWVQVDPAGDGLEIQEWAAEVIAGGKTLEFTFLDLHSTNKANREPSLLEKRHTREREQWTIPLNVKNEAKMDRVKKQREERERAGY